MSPEDAKPVEKHEIEDDEDEKSINSVLQSHKKKSSNSITPKRARVKKEEINGDIEEHNVKKSSYKVKKKQSKVTKEEYEEPTAKRSSKKTEKKKTKEGKKGEKKMYDLPGQKRDPPQERDTLRIFYETLYQQVPNSEMAAFWMMESGLLPKEEAKKVYEKKLKKKQQQKLGSPMKAVITVNKSGESVTVKRKSISSSPPKKKTPESKVPSKLSKKRKIEDDSSYNGSDDDFVLGVRKAKKQREG